jgi:hypothetical protein
VEATLSKVPPQRRLLALTLAFAAGVAMYFGTTLFFGSLPGGLLAYQVSGYMSTSALLLLYALEDLLGVIISALAFAAFSWVMATWLGLRLSGRRFRNSIIVLVVLLIAEDIFEWVVIDNWVISDASTAVVANLLALAPGLFFAIAWWLGMRPAAHKSKEDK